MKQMMEKGLLLLGCACFMNTTNVTFHAVAFFLGVIVIGLEEYWQERRYKCITAALLLLAGMGMTQALIFVPVVIYIFEKEKNPKGVWCSAAIFLLSYERVIEMYGQRAYVELIFLGVIGGVLARRTQRVLHLEEEIIHLRDQSQELELYLKGKNKDLMEKQDYEIHLATLRERNRIAREIHDNVGHMLSRCLLQVGALLVITKGNEPVQGALESMKGTLNVAMNNIRESVHDLHDDSIDLKQAVSECIKEMEQNYQVKYQYDMTNDVPKNVRYCFLTIVKEGLSNIVKHSTGDAAEVILREHPAFYQLAVKDNGDTKGVSLEGGMGLENMRERVKSFKGTFHVSTKNGFQIFVTVPKEEKK